MLPPRSRLGWFCCCCLTMVRVSVVALRTTDCAGIRSTPACFHSCSRWDLQLLCSCCSLLKDTVMRACIVVCFCAVAAHCTRTRSCMRALWSASVQLLLTAHKHGHACVCIVVCFCAAAAHCSRTRSCVRALWSASVQLLLTAQGHGQDRKSTRLNSSHSRTSRMPSSA